MVVFPAGGYVCNDDKSGSVLSTKSTRTEAPAVTVRGMDRYHDSLDRTCFRNGSGLSKVSDQTTISREREKRRLSSSNFPWSCSRSIPALSTSKLCGRTTILDRYLDSGLTLVCELHVGMVVGHYGPLCGKQCDFIRGDASRRTATSAKIFRTISIRELET